ncbi:30S ribosomal protein S11 [Candidatus Synchoanobacter obligatus]|uniref:Small ribosomal subunit protein uS11 n=1 Tax=Candidatus Synchoanobacter obligatus TaxID=2919597 RepID=A0ABT1L6J9_9GAMM|nr:30S ribosomal protein S11 [Candidatus Synchoanobacter obligatus]MCP8352508.1 30S ribosomal protein S11 [Candidatus Synchoanobacter obligatus]
MKTSTRKKAGKHGATVSSVGTIYIKATSNNTIITCANQKDQTIRQESGGSAGFKNSRKGTSEAAEVAAKRLGEYIKSRGMTTVVIKLNGAGQGREGAIRGLVVSGLTVTTLHDVTGVAHNGVKKKKRQRK